MSSFQISLTPSRRAAGRFVLDVRKRLLKAIADDPEVCQSSIADELGVNRSVISKQLHGRQDINLGRVAEIAWALGYVPCFDLVREESGDGCNHIIHNVPAARKVETDVWSSQGTFVPDMRQVKATEPA